MTLKKKNPTYCRKIMSYKWDMKLAIQRQKKNRMQKKWWADQTRRYSKKKKDRKKELNKKHM